MQKVFSDMVPSWFKSNKGGELRLQSGRCAIPHPDKAKVNPDPREEFSSFGAGEDSGLINDRQSMLGIADGVGGWGVCSDSAFISRKALHQCSQYLKYHDKAGKSCQDLTRAMKQVWKEMRKTEMRGSTTLLLMHYDDTTSTFNVANMGDCGWILIRKGRIKHIGKTSELSFNKPYQLGPYTPSAHDPAQVAACERLKAKSGDILVLASDGCFDNVFKKEILQIVNKHTKRGIIDPNATAQALAEYAVKASNLPRASPFAVAANGSKYHGWQGGKVDDTCVIVSQLVKAQNRRNTVG